MNKITKDRKEQVIPLLHEIVRAGRLVKNNAFEAPKPTIRPINDPDVGNLTEIIDAKATDAGKETLSKLSRLGQKTHTIKTTITPKTATIETQQLEQLVQASLERLLPQIITQISNDIKQYIDQRLTKDDDK